MKSLGWSCWTGFKSNTLSFLSCLRSSIEFWNKLHITKEVYKDELEITSCLQSFQTPLVSKLNRNSFISSFLLLCVDISHCMTPLSTAQRAASSPVLSSGSWHSFLPGRWKGWKWVMILLFFSPLKQKHPTLSKIPNGEEKTFMWCQQDRSSWGQELFHVPSTGGTKALLMWNSKNATQTTDITLTLCLAETHSSDLRHPSYICLAHKKIHCLQTLFLTSYSLTSAQPCHTWLLLHSAKVGRVQVRVDVWARVRSESFLTT